MQRCSLLKLNKKYHLCVCARRNICATREHGDILFSTVSTQCKMHGLFCHSRGCIPAVICRSYPHGCIPAVICPRLSPRLFPWLVPRPHSYPAAVPAVVLTGRIKSHHNIGHTGLVTNNIISPHLLSSLSYLIHHHASKSHNSPQSS